MVVAPMPASWATIPTSTVAMSGTCPLSTAVISLVIRSRGGTTVYSTSMPVASDHAWTNWAMNSL